MKRMISPEELTKMIPDFKEGIVTDNLTFGKTPYYNLSSGKDHQGFITLKRYNDSNPKKFLYVDYNFWYTQFTLVGDSGGRSKLSFNVSNSWYQPFTFSVEGWDDEANKAYVSVYIKRLGDKSVTNGVIPCVADPTEDGTYTLKLVKNGTSFTYQWVKEVA